MVEYVDTAVFFCSRFVQDDVEEVVLIEAVSEDEALDVLIRREKGLEGMVCEVVGWFWCLCDGLQEDLRVWRSLVRRLLGYISKSRDGSR
jgi:hypothetical protein